MGKIDTSFSTEQRDLFASGVVAEIGVNAYAVWSAIKYHADFNTGESFPGVRKIGEILGISKSTVDRAVDVLLSAHMLRVVKKSGRNRGQTYIARERLSVRIANRVVCTIAIDYVPTRLRDQVAKLKQSIETGQHDPELWATVDVLPGEGFSWDPDSKSLRGYIDPSTLPSPDHGSNDDIRQLGEAVLARARGNK